MKPAGACYREFAPCEALEPYVSSFFTFTVPADGAAAGRVVTRQILFPPAQRPAAPLLADGHVSIVFSFGAEYRVDGLWSPGPCGPSGHVIGAMSTARPASHGKDIVQVGAYLRAAQAEKLTAIPASELTDRIVALADLWGGEGAALEARLAEAENDAQRVSMFERALVQRLAQSKIVNERIDVPCLANYALTHSGALTVEQLADAAGVSRQYLTRNFREAVGVTPKLYCRLARFRASLAHVRSNGDGADVAAALGYFDQSHMIAEFRQFAGMTPGQIAREQRFHPFAPDRL